MKSKILCIRQVVAAALYPLVANDCVGRKLPQILPLVHKPLLRSIALHRQDSHNYRIKEKIKKKKIRGDVYIQKFDELVHRAQQGRPVVC